MSYNEDNVKGKLTSLNESQDSIVTVAQWIMFHRRYAAQTAQLWVATLQESPTANKKLNLLYLANEVVQQSRARGKMDFKIAFEPVIADATASAYKAANPDVQGKIRRVVEVWRQRNIFDAPIQQSVEKKLDEVDKTKGAGKLGGGVGRLGGSLFGGGSGSVASELEPINKIQVALNKAETASKTPITAANAKYAETTDPATVVPSAPVRAAKLRGLVKDLMAAQNAVEASMNSRRELLDGLEKLIATNRAQLAQDEVTSRDLGTKIDSMETIIRDVEDSIMRGVEPLPVNGNGNGIEPERPETEGFTPPPPEIESFTPPGEANDTDQIDMAPLEAPFRNPTGADPIEEQPPNRNEPPPAFVPQPTITAADDAATQAQAFLATLDSLKGTVRGPSGEIPSSSSDGNPGDPRLKRRKMSHRPSGDVDDEIFGQGVGGVDEDGIAAMLGQ
ncbi:UPF0400 protein [Cercospora beticola]|uniref:UPF0400 protein n=1 Tax=Cercospora beticola TaxID=122368 RepID=A0A2G5HQE6_CERBT|nr:UPF0400 protein [Cercospora beticola]PIA94754.1 UPF0400 protein [Cercospora beticola]WPB04569.1 hypothetical protein RHO25_009215 [Cercospora beticola]